LVIPEKGQHGMKKIRPLYATLLFAASFISTLCSATYYETPLRNGQTARLEVVTTLDQLEVEASQKVLVASFGTEYAKIGLKPQDISPELTCWKKFTGIASVEGYYEDYFLEETNKFLDKKFIWVKASVAGKVVGFATFLPEKNHGLYLDLLAVDTSMQGQGLGRALVFSLLSLQVLPETTSIHLLLRKLNAGGRIFYQKLGFSLDNNYKCSMVNHVDESKLEAWSLFLNDHS
jgi:GNAT superfamily N-acetyltransferase